VQSQTELRVGLCGIGLEAYWSQFPGLKPQLESFVARLVGRLARPGVHLVELGLIDSPSRAQHAGRECRRADIDVLFIYVTTYALSNCVLPLVQRAGVPVVVLNLQPEAAIDYETFNRLPDRNAMTGNWLAFCSACPVPEMANVLRRANVAFHQVIGFLNDADTWAEIDAWLSAAAVKHALANGRLGLMGHYYSGMLDVMTDVTQVSITLGTHVELLEVDELSAICNAISHEAISERVQRFRSHFDVQPDCAEQELRRAARTSVAMDRFVEQHDIQMLAYYYEGSGNPANEDTISSIILGTSMLTARHIPVAGEYEVKNVLAMKIMDCLGAGGSFTEYYAIDFAADVVLMGHDGPGHTGIAEGKTKVRPLQVYHGKVGRGLSVEMSVRTGPVTLLSVVEDAAHGFKLLVAEGECELGPTLAIANTNSRYRFPIGARKFIEGWNAQGPAHHCAVGVGHIATQLEKTAKLLGLPIYQVC
jgi:L-arabinose isomerase